MVGRFPIFVARRSIASETLTIKQTKSKYYKPSPQEEQILTGLVTYQKFLPTSVIKELLERLCVYSLIGHTRKFETDGIINMQERGLSVTHI